MQTLTTQELNYLYSHLQVGDQGHRARVEIDRLVPASSEIGVSTPSFARLYGPTLPGHATSAIPDVVPWNRSGDNPESGYPIVPRYGLMDYWPQSGKVSTVLCKGAAFDVYHGLIALGDGTLTLHFKFNLNVVVSSATATADLLRNGTEVLASASDSTSGGLHSWQPTFEATASGVTVSANDTFTVRLTRDFGCPGAFALPIGAGDTTLLFEATGTLAVTQEIAASFETLDARVKVIDHSKSRRTAAAQVQVAIPIADGSASLISPTSPLVTTNAPIRVFEWYGDDPADEVRTFTGYIDSVIEKRDPRELIITARDRMKLLIEQSITVDSPQGADEDGAVRTTANYVYLESDVDTTLTDLLDKAGYPTADRDIFPTSYAIEEYFGTDGQSYADAILGDERLSGLCGYDGWTDEQGVFKWYPFLRTSSTDADDVDPTPDYSYVIGDAGANNLVSALVMNLEHEIDEYDLRTRVKVRGTIATAVPAWAEEWHTSKFNLPVGLWYDATQSTHLRVLDRGTRKIYNLIQATREKDPAGIYPIDISGDVTYPLGLSGDPADATVFWVLEAAWRVGAGNSASIHKYNATTGAHVAEYAIADGQWTDMKVGTSNIWLTSFSTDKIHKHSKTDGSSVASYTVTYNGNAQVNPSGIFIDGTTLGPFFYSKARFLLVDTSDPTTIDTTNALGVTSGRVKTTGTKILGGEMDTTTHADLYACSDDLGLVWKYNLTTPSTDSVTVEVVDTDLEDELGLLSSVADREHDTHPGDADHAFEIRRETLSIAKILDNVAQATDTATRKLAELAHRREVLDLGVVGHPGLQRGDLIQVTDAVTGIDALYSLDTIRSHMDDRGYVARLALLPYEPSY